MSKSFMSLIKLCRTQRLWREEIGQDLIEYSLLGALIAVVCVTAMPGLVRAINALFGTITAVL